MTRPYGEGEDEEFFTFSVFLVMNNRLVSIVRGGHRARRHSRRGRTGGAHHYKYAAVSCSNVIATTPVRGAQVRLVPRPTRQVRQDRFRS